MENQDFYKLDRNYMITNAAGGERHHRIASS
jgi:hypothetical protein